MRCFFDRVSSLGGIDWGGGVPFLVEVSSVSTIGEGRRWMDSQHKRTHRVRPRLGAPGGVCGGNWRADFQKLVNFKEKYPLFGKTQYG